jgi:hypothetical protein
MSIRALWFATLMVAVLAVAAGAAQMLELPAEMDYDARTYVAINTSLYPLFARVGGTLQVLAMVGSLGLAFQVRSQPVFGLTLSGALCLVLSVGLWFVLVLPANIEWARIADAVTTSLAEANGRLRNRWEYGELVAFTVWFMGVSVLVYSALRTRPHTR